MDILNTIGSICSIVSLIISLTTLCKVNQIKNKIEQKTNSFINKGTISNSVNTNE